MNNTSTDGDSESFMRRDEHGNIDYSVKSIVFMPHAQSNGYAFDYEIRSYNKNSYIVVRAKETDTIGFIVEKLKEAIDRTKQKGQSHE